MYVFLSRDTKTNQIEHAYQTRPKTKLIESYVVGLYAGCDNLLFSWLPDRASLVIKQMPRLAQTTK